MHLGDNSYVSINQESSHSGLASPNELVKGTFSLILDWIPLVIKSTDNSWENSDDF